MSYLINKNADLHILRTSSLSINHFSSAILKFDETIKKLCEFEIDISSILGMRNLSAFIGEVLVISLEKAVGGLVIKNPHQDGYPDLLLMDEEGLRHWKSLSGREREKGPFSPFETGGVEIKATCGSVPTPAQCLKQGRVKPEIGDQRIDFLKGYDWKAHHQETNRLIGIVWDFIDSLPVIVGLFYCSSLNVDDWGGIIQPKPGGGRTTSVSIMTRGGVRKMYESWVMVFDNPKYIDLFNRHNKGDLITTNSGN
jgi:hypothetical protein